MEVLSKRIRGISPSLTLAISAKAKAMKAAGEDVVNFGAGEPDFNTPEHIIKAAEDALERGCTKYTPAAGLPELRRAICEKFARDNGLEYEPSQIVVSNGAKHSIFNVCFALLEPGEEDEVIIPAPYWLTYPEVVKTCGGVPVIVNTSKKNNFKITPEELRAAITPKTKLFIFNSPCNPTGAVYSEAEVRALAKVCEETGIYVLADEIYEKLVYGEEKPFSMAAVSPWMMAHTITVNGVSKTYSMTGWRIGYLGAPLEIAKAISSFQSHATSNPNSIAQYATIKALNSPEASVEEMVARFARRRLALIERVSEMKDVYCIIPEGAFYAMLVVSSTYGKSFGSHKIVDSVSFSEVLLDAAKVAVVPGKAFGADDCVRISYSLSMKDMLEGLERIDAFVQSLQ